MQSNAEVLKVQLKMSGGKTKVFQPSSQDKPLSFSRSESQCVERRVNSVLPFVNLPGHYYTVCLSWSKRVPEASSGLSQKKQAQIQGSALLALYEWEREQ